MSGLRSASQVRAESVRCLMELTFQVAIRTGATCLVLKGEARAATAGRRSLRIVDLERRADQIVDEVDLAAGHVIERDRIDQHRGAALLDDDVVVSPVTFGVEFVLEA